MARKLFGFLVLLAVLGAGLGVVRILGAQAHGGGETGHDPRLPAAEAGGSASQAGAAGPVVTLYKSPTCTCCGNWGDHLREAGFEVRDVILDDVQAVMEERGVPMHLRSCHLGIVGDYVVVGHVPADLAARLLEEKPEVTGIAVPGMPRGSPGMEGFGGDVRYDVIAFGPNGAEHVFATR